MVGFLALVTYALLAFALFRSDGHYEPVALACVLLALAAAVAGASIPFGEKAERFGQRWSPALLNVVVAVEIALHLLRGPSIGLLFPLLVAPLCLLYLHRDLLAWGRFVLIAATFAVFAALTIPTSPPAIDVWMFQQLGCAHLLRGENPYAATYPNIYEDARFYADANLKDGRVVSFPYPPLNLLLAMPGYLVGDIRWGLGAALVGTTLLMVAAGRRLGLSPGHHAELAAAALLLHPGAVFLLDQSWTEPFLALAFAFAAWAATGKSLLLRSVGVAGIIAAKQYGLLLVPPLWAARRIGWQEVVLGGVFALLVALPFIAWDGPALWRGSVAFHLHQPFRLDSLSLPALVSRATGWQMPAAFGFLAAGAVTAWTAWRGGATLAHAALGSTAVLLAFFLFSKTAFFNYYWLTTVTAALAVIAAAGLRQSEPASKKTEAEGRLS